MIHDVYGGSAGNGIPNESGVIFFENHAGYKVWFQWDTKTNVHISIQDDLDASENEVAQNLYSMTTYIGTIELTFPVDQGDFLSQFRVVKTFAKQWLREHDQMAIHELLANLPDTE